MEWIINCFRNRNLIHLKIEPKFKYIIVNFKMDKLPCIMKCSTKDLDSIKELLSSMNLEGDLSLPMDNNTLIFLMCSQQQFQTLLDRGIQISIENQVGQLLKIKNSIL